MARREPVYPAARPGWVKVEGVFRGESPDYKHAEAQRGVFAYEYRNGRPVSWCVMWVGQGLPRPGDVFDSLEAALDHVEQVIGPAWKRCVED